MSWDDGDEFREAEEKREAQAALCSKELLGGWWVVDKNHDNAKRRGPYKHAETAAAVRQEIESAASERLNEYWNLAVVRIP